MRGHDVPAEHPLLEPELVEDPAHDGGCRLGRPDAGDLPLRHERDSRDPRSSIAGRLADEQDIAASPCLEIGGQPLSAQPSVAVLVERPSDPCGRELGNECVSRYDKAAA